MIKPINTRIWTVGEPLNDPAWAIFTWGDVGFPAFDDEAGTFRSDPTAAVSDNTPAGANLQDGGGATGGSGLSDAQAAGGIRLPPTVPASAAPSPADAKTLSPSTLASSASSPRSPTVAIAQVVNFDDLTGTVLPIPTGYMGFTWGASWYFLNGPAYGLQYGPNGYTNGTVSVPNVAFNAYAGDIEISRGTDFDFTSADFTAAWRNGLQVEVTGYDDGVQQYHQIFSANYTGPTHALFGMLSVDHVTIHTSGGVEAPGLYGSGAHVAIDNLAFDVSSGSFTIRGRFDYSDKPYSTSGFTGNRADLPIRFATVEIWEADVAVLGGGYRLGTTHTAADGSWSFNVSNNTDTYGLNGRDIYVKVFADTAGSVVAAGSVVNGSSAKYFYKGTTINNW